MNYKEGEKLIMGFLDSLRPLEERYPSIAECVKNIREELDDSEFRITVVGEFSSGKSTFLNALIGKSVLASANQETTAAITYIHNVNGSNPLCGKALVHLNNGKEIKFDLNNKEQMKEYTSRLNNNGKLNVAQDVQSVDLYVNFPHTDEKIVLIDTPGLNGMAAGHAELTTNEIASSHASICLFGFKGLSATDVEFLKNLMRHQSTFFFLQNFIDMYKIDENEYPEQKVKEFKEMIARELYNDRQQPKYAFGISSLRALVARDTSIKKLYQNDEDELTPQKRQECLKESGILEVEDVIFSFINSKERLCALFDSMLGQIKSVLDDILESATNTKDIKERSVTINPDIKYLEKLLKESEEKINQFRSQIPWRISNKFDDLKRNVGKTIASDLVTKKNELVTKIDSLGSIEEIKSFQSNKRLDSLIRNFDLSERVRIPKLIDDDTSTLISEVFSEIKRRIPRLDISNNKQLNVRGLNTDFTVDVDTSIKSNIQKMQEDVKNRQQELYSLERREHVVRGMEDSRRVNKNQLDYVENQITRMGSRPPIRTRIVTREVQERKGFFGRLWGFFSGSGSYRTVTEKFEETDDSERKAYDQRKSQYKAQLEMYKRAKNDIDWRLKGESSLLIRKEIERKRKIIEQKQREIEKAVEDERRMMEVSKSNAIRKFKKQMKDAVEELFRTESPFGEIYSNYMDWCDKMVKSCNENVEQEMLKYYDEKASNFLSELKSLISSKKTEEEKKEINQSIKLLQGDIANLNNSLNEIDKLQQMLV